VTDMREPAPSLTLPPRETRKDSIFTNLMFALVGGWFGENSYQCFPVFCLHFSIDSM